VSSTENGTQKNISDKNTEGAFVTQRKVWKLEWIEEKTKIKIFNLSVYLKINSSISEIWQATRETNKKLQIFFLSAGVFAHYYTFLK
jgi:hypothetical protein